MDQQKNKLRKAALLYLLIVATICVCQAAIPAYLDNSFGGIDDELRYWFLLTIGTIHYVAGIVILAVRKK